MELSFKDLLEKVEKCPPDNYKNLECEAFRWVFDDIENEDNFKPQGIKNPKRLNTNNANYCAILALSFFNSEKKARSRFEMLLEQMGENAKKALGTKIAKGYLDLDDGIGEDANSSGHFNYHPKKDYNFTEKFEIISIL